MVNARSCLALLILGWFSAPALLAADEARMDYNRDVRPILAKNCFACHGPDNAQRAAGLRLDQRDAAVQARKNRPAAIVPGKAQTSELIRRITTAEESERMPPKESGHPLTPEQITTLQRWVQQGAPYAEHWAFVRPTQGPLPAVKNRTWVLNPIDHFVLAQLEKAGLTPAPEADRYTLIRRLSLDLRGLPPTSQEIAAFVEDSSPLAYERLVDRFLQDSAYGERWARVWLDLARYADSAGYGSDPLRTIWRYRDWVIDAYNRNLPYDQFSLEQLAGDLLPNATLEQKIATAFHRNTMTNTEGGTDDEEFRVAAVKDRVDTTLQVWMGLTMGCAKCHNHKYDPITQADYYRFYAFFNQTADADRPDEIPLLSAPTPTQLAEIRSIDERIANLRRQLEQSSPELSAAQRQWEANVRGTAEWQVLEVTNATAERGARLHRLEDGSVRAEGTNPPNDTYSLTAITELTGITGLRLEAIPDPKLPKGGSGRGDNGSFVLSHIRLTAAPAKSGSGVAAGRILRIDLPGADRILSLAEVQVFRGEENIARHGQATQSSTDYEGEAARAIDGVTNGAYFEANSVTHTRHEANPWWELRLPATGPIDRIVLWNRTDGETSARLVNFRVSLLDEARKVVWSEQIADAPMPNRTLIPGSEKEVALRQVFADFAEEGLNLNDIFKTGAKGKPGWGVAPKQKSTHGAVFTLGTPLEGPTRLTIRLDHQSRKAGANLGRFRLSVTNDPRVLERARLPADILAILDTPSDKQTKEQTIRLAQHYRTIAPALQPFRDEIARLEKLRPAPATVPVMAELPREKRRETRIMVKGNHLSLSDKVEAGVPAVFHPLPATAAPDRLAVARWLFDEANPLTGRVAVNRLWAQLWGRGLVETEEDFGTQGELPSHPELLDWLAVEYRRLGWDTKALLRLLVTSAAYRQTSQVTSERAARDPRNRLLSRGARYRLEAELVRDQALNLSGLLSRKMSGPSVFPPQPDGLWQAAFNGQRTWATSTGPDRYRRGVYVFWRRTVPYPSMATFDAPSREICAVRRIRTNTPLQAFVTLNDPVYVEAAQALARRIVREGGASDTDRMRFGLELCLGRPARAEQIQQLERLYRSELSHYRAHPKDAATLATDPLGPLPSGMATDELAAWTVLANVLLNLDGVLTRS